MVLIIVTMKSEALYKSSGLYSLKVILNWHFEQAQQAQEYTRRRVIVDKVVLRVFI